jgi:hypothetical protein
VILENNFMCFQICNSQTIYFLRFDLKSPLDQNPRVIYQKFNGDFKSHINFGGTKGGQGDDCSITHKKKLKP